MKKFFIYSYLFLILSASLFFYYYLPKTIKVYVVGTEIKREIRSSGNEEDLTKDIRYVVARSLEEGETLMFRNEDIPWPPYFKFNSGDLSGKVMNYQKYEEDKLFLATFYGWRIPLISMYPNLTSASLLFLTNLSEISSGSSCRQPPTAPDLKNCGWIFFNSSKLGTCFCLISRAIPICEKARCTHATGSLTRSSNFINAVSASERSIQPTAKLPHRLRFARRRESICFQTRFCIFSALAKKMKRVDTKSREASNKIFGWKMPTERDL